MDKTTDQNFCVFSQIGLKKIVNEETRKTVIKNGELRVYVVVE